VKFAISVARIETEGATGLFDANDEDLVRVFVFLPPGGMRDSPFFLVQPPFCACCADFLFMEDDGLDFWR